MGFSCCREAEENEEEATPREADGAETVKEAAEGAEALAEDVKPEALSEAAKDYVEATTGQALPSRVSSRSELRVSFGIYMGDKDTENSVRLQL